MTVAGFICGFLIASPVVAILTGKFIAKSNSMDIIEECNLPPCPPLDDPEAVSAWFQGLVLVAVLNQVEPAGQG